MRLLLTVALTLVALVLTPWSAAAGTSVGAAPNNGLLLKLGEAEEDFDVSGPYFPSRSYPNASVHPQLVITYS